MLHAQTCLDAAVAKARSQEKTPLLLDSPMHLAVDDLMTSRGAYELETSPSLHALP